MILWTNATFYSMEDCLLTYDKVLTEEGIIIALGNDTLKYSNYQTIDLKGSYVFPGFSESHLHLIGYGRKLFSNNLKLDINKESVLAKIKKFYKNEKLLIEGYVNIGITKDDLDLISSDNIIILRHNDYHSFTVNSKVLEMLNIKNSNGIILDDLISSKITKVWESNDKVMLTKITDYAIKDLKKLGFTSVHTDDLSYFNSYDETIEILNLLSKTNNFRINTLIHHSVLDSFIKYYPNNKLLNPIQIKVFYDGTLSSKTALISENYVNSNNNGKRYITDKDFLNLLKKARSLSKGLAIHTIGDLAFSEVIKLLSLEKPSSEMDRIVHGSLASDDLILELKNIAIDIQPHFIKSDKEVIRKNINHQTNIYPFDKYNKKVLINTSSDAPVEDPNPLLNMYELNNISRFDMIKSYTVNPYLTINKKGGLIKEGYYADFTCFDKDIMKIEKEELLDTKVLYTIIDEKM